ncbi:relaxin-3 receptor 1-like [Takifugu rubripes]|uniref:relaxin-3 receptor 1-like n=1 Tax=Takifugu rubripes TaxID=31033 RepID=UPI0002990122|nr:relaxin-3 receptor 1-like [Takifugu rubripes]|eukprot:XP_003969861.1 PREDICTED: relaxin-3 receptor 1-like [Takifugu rubripes]
MDELFNQSSAAFNLSNESFNFDDIDDSADGSFILRILISVVYSVVCAVGLVGNLLVFFLMRLRQGRKRSTINIFIINLAVTDFQFVLTLPFWAVDTAQDFSWPFGDAMCKIILSVTVMNMYASVFFLTAMSVTRYLSVASALKKKTCRSRCVKWVCAVLWVAATVATAPTAFFSTVTEVAGEKLCLLKFPEGHDWLALYHIQKILIAFIIPMLIVSVNYLMLLRFLRLRSMGCSNPKRRSRVTKSVAIVVLSFFFCWMPNQAITFWGVLVKFNAVNWDKSYYMVHTYVFPVTVCLAHANSCLNPVLYCLMRPEIRKMLSGLFWRVPTPPSPADCPTRLFTHGEIQRTCPLQNQGKEDCVLAIVDRKGLQSSKVISYTR